MQLHDLQKHLQKQNIIFLEGERVFIILLY